MKRKDHTAESRRRKSFTQDMQQVFDDWVHKLPVLRKEPPATGAVEINIPNEEVRKPDAPQVPSEKEIDDSKTAAHPYPAPG